MGMPRPRSSTQMRLPSTVMNLPAVEEEEEGEEDGACAQAVAAPAASATKPRRENGARVRVVEEGFGWRTESLGESVLCMRIYVEILVESMSKAAGVVKSIISENDPLDHL